MTFTILFALMAILLLLIVFFVVYKWKGLKTALIVTGITFVLLAVTFMIAIGVIISSMPN